MSLSLVIGKISFMISWFNDLSIIGEIIDKAILGLFSLDAGHMIISALWIAFTALTVRRSTSPGPTPIPTNPGMKIVPFYPIKNLD